MYPVFALWVRSHQDLPLNVYQIVNTFRYETKTTRPFLRVREIHFFEEHTCQVDEAAATARVARTSRRSAGWPPRSPSRSSRSADRSGTSSRARTTRSPSTSRSGRPGPSRSEASTTTARTSRARTGSGTRPPTGIPRLVHQTTFGLSERLLGAILAVHGDAKGAVFPRAIAPYEVVVIPILSAIGR